MIFQDPISALNPRRKVGQIVTEPLSIWSTPVNEQRSLPTTISAGIVMVGAVALAALAALYVVVAVLAFFGGEVTIGPVSLDSSTGGGFKGLKHGQHRVAKKENTPLANLWTTMLLDAGVEVDRFADANATASSIWG